jgi:hypothetical protein
VDGVLGTHTLVRATAKVFEPHKVPGASGDPRPVRVGRDIEQPDPPGGDLDLPVGPDLAAGGLTTSRRCPSIETASGRP